MMMHIDSLYFQLCYIDWMNQLTVSYSHIMNPPKKTILKNLSSFVK